MSRWPRKGFHAERKERARARKQLATHPNQFSEAYDANGNAGASPPSPHGASGDVSGSQGERRLRPRMAPPAMPCGRIGLRA
eukprot:5538822-Alexandrium_andersonii.AAC.1